VAAESNTGVVIQKWIKGTFSHYLLNTQTR
jgi:hypothetical protein